MKSGKIITCKPTHESHVSSRPWRVASREEDLVYLNQKHEAGEIVERNI
jgi:hypothetical protein